jgi:hypothetical protein
VQHVSDWYTHRRSIMHEPLQVNDVRTLECIIRIEPDQPPLRIGQRVRVILNGTDSPSKTMSGLAGAESANRR